MKPFKPFKPLKGTIQIKTIRGRQYAYDAWYDPKTKNTRTDYIGPWGKSTQEVTKIINPLSAIDLLREIDGKAQINEEELLQVFLNWLEGNVQRTKVRKIGRGGKVNEQYFYTVQRFPKPPKTNGED